MCESRRAATGGRFAEINMFIRQTGKNCTPTEWRTWMVLWDHVFPPGGITRPISQEEIAKLLGCTPRNVRKALSGLIAKGFVDVFLRGDSRGRANTYRVRANPNPEVQD